MKITVRARGLAIPIMIYIPLGIVKSGFLWDKAFKHSDPDDRQWLELGKNLAPQCAEALREAARANGGHFNLVEVESADGSEVTIRI